MQLCLTTVAVLKTNAQYRGSGRGKVGEGCPDPAFPFLFFHENPASRTVFSSVYQYPESRFSFPGKYIKKSFLQKIINAGYTLTRWIDILNLRVCLKVPAKKKFFFYLSTMKEHDMIITISGFSPRPLLLAISANPVIC